MRFLQIEKYFFWERKMQKKNKQMKPQKFSPSLLKKFKVYNFYVSRHQKQANDEFLYMINIWRHQMNCWRT